MIQKNYDPLVRYLTIPNRSYRILKAVLGFSCLMLEHFINQMVVVGCWLAPLDKYLINCPRPCMFLMFFCVPKHMFVAARVLQFCKPCIRVPSGDDRHRNEDVS